MTTGGLRPRIEVSKPTAALCECVLCVCAVKLNSMKVCLQVFCTLPISPLRRRVPCPGQHTQPTRRHQWKFLLVLFVFSMCRAYVRGVCARTCARVYEAPMQSHLIEKFRPACCQCAKACTCGCYGRACRPNRRKWGQYVGWVSASIIRKLNVVSIRDKGSTGGRVNGNVEFTTLSSRENRRSGVCMALKCDHTIKK